MLFFFDRTAIHHHKREISPVRSTDSIILTSGPRLAGHRDTRGPCRTQTRKESGPQRNWSAREKPPPPSTFGAPFSPCQNTNLGFTLPLPRRATAVQTIQAATGPARLPFPLSGAHLPAWAGGGVQLPQEADGEAEAAGTGGGAGRLRRRSSGCAWARRSSSRAG